VSIVFDTETTARIKHMIAEEISVQLGYWLSASVDRRQDLAYLAAQGRPTIDPADDLVAHDEALGLYDEGDPMKVRTGVPVGAAWARWQEVDWQQKGGPVITQPIRAIVPVSEAVLGDLYQDTMLPVDVSQRVGFNVVGYRHEDEIGDDW
jgi:hypothetical protein